MKDIRIFVVLASLLCELIVPLISCPCEKLNRLNRGERGQCMGGGERIMCSCTSGSVNGSESSSALKSSDIRMASSDTISSMLSTKLSRLTSTFLIKGLSWRDKRSACISSSISLQRPGVRLNVDTDGDVFLGTPRFLVQL